MKSINISKDVATGLGIALGKKVSTHESPARMAWLVLIAKQIPDKETFFPRGRSATIRDIESQLEEAAQSKTR